MHEAIEIPVAYLESLVQRANKPPEIPEKVEGFEVTWLRDLRLAMARYNCGKTCVMRRIRGGEVNE